MSAQLLLIQDRESAGGQPQTLLSAEGYKVVATDEPAQALLQLHQGPDLCLVDVDLTSSREGWGGYCQECRERGVPCLLFSGGGRQTAALQRLEGEVDGVLRPPGAPAELLEKVAQLVRIRRLQASLTRVRQLLKKREMEKEEDLRSAAQIQQSLIPARMPNVDNYQFAWRFLPFEKIGGDLFNVLQLDEDTVMAYLFDVSGHGVSSAMVGVSVYQSLSLQTGRIVKRVFVAPPYYKILSPEEVLLELEQEYPFDRFEKFFTITYLLLNLANGRVRYSSAGHPPPILVRKEGGMELLRAGGGLIGLGIGPPFSEEEIQLEAGDRLYLYSDGIPEFCDQDGEIFGEARFLTLLEELRNLPLRPGCDRVLEGLRRFGGGAPLQDDVTLLAIEFQGL